MKIYIPKHIRSLPIIDNLRKMIEAYKSDNMVDSFKDYQDSMKFDPVYKYLNLVYPEGEGWESKDINLSYLSNLFYRVKGTYKVIDYLVSFGILGDWETVGEEKATYNGKKVTLYIPSIKFDKKLYCTYLKEFLDALLFFNELFIEIGKIEISVEGDVSSSLTTGSFKYRYYEG